MDKITLQAGELQANVANVVSVGDAAMSMTRKIIKLADGTANTDAVTVGQLNTALATVGTGATGAFIC